MKRLLLTGLLIIGCLLPAAAGGCGTCQTGSSAAYRDEWEACMYGSDDPLSVCESRATHARSCWIIAHWPDCSECQGMSPEGGCN